jgi:hypothetical protein
MQNRPLILILVAIAATGLLAFVITGICNAGLKDRFEIESVAPRDSASEGSKIDIGDAEWTSGRVGFSTIYVPFVLRAKGGPVTLDIEGGRFTILASVQVDGTDVAKTQVNQNRYEFVAPPTEKTAKGVLKLSQPSDKEPFSISVRYDNETKKKSFEPPLDTQFPPDTARSDNIDLGPIERTGSKIQIRFSLKERSGDKVRVLWRAPVRSTFFESASFEGQKLADEQVKSVSSESEKELMLPPTGKSGTIVYQQTGEVDFRVWIVHGEGTASLMVPRGVRDDNEPGDKPTLPPTVTPVLETAKNMVDLNAFPFQAREPVQSRVLAISKRIELGVPTAERVSNTGTGYVVRLPFELNFSDEEVPPDTKLVFTWDLDPATTQVRHLARGKAEIRPTTQMSNSSSFETAVRPGEDFELVLDQPLGRRAVSVSVAYAGESTKVLLEGAHPQERSAGFVGSMEPVDFKGNPAIRFTDVHETAEQRVVALYKSESGSEPDEQTTKFLMTKYFEWSGDMKRLGNLAASITTMVSNAPDAESKAVQRAVSALEAGASPAEAADALKHWKEYETHKAMWRPDTTRGGYPGDAAMKRPWAETAVVLSEGHSSDMPAVAENAASMFEVNPGESTKLEGQADWLFV